MKRLRYGDLSVRGQRYRIFAGGVVETLSGGGSGRAAVEEAMAVRLLCGFAQADPLATAGAQYAEDVGGVFVEGAWDETADPFDPEAIY